MDKALFLFAILFILISTVSSKYKRNRRMEWRKHLTKPFLNDFNDREFIARKVDEHNIIFKQRVRREISYPNKQSLSIRDVQVDYTSRNLLNDINYPMPKEQLEELYNNSKNQYLSYFMRTPQKIRLRGDYLRYMNPNEGRVEMFKDGRWQLVCDDYWDRNDANVACRQLGFVNGASRAYRSAYFGISTVPQNTSISSVMSCTGSERYLQRCSQSNDEVSDCLLKSTAALQCVYNEGCKRGWTSFGGVCYRIEREAVDFATARRRCLSKNATLIYVLSEEENNFLSNTLFTKFKNITAVWTGAMYAYYLENEIGYETWAWTDTIHTVNEALHFKGWFPGFTNSPKQLQRPLQPLNERSCLALNSKFQFEGRFRDAQYFWWDNVSCKQLLPFICQKTASTGDCYNTADKGVSYNGKASRTESGSPCLAWSNNIVDFFTRTSFCQNPDHDVKPWCWVDHKNFIYGFCQLSPCSAEKSTPTTSPPPTVNNEIGFNKGSCPPTQFHCPSMSIYSEQRCINKNLVCNGKIDCFVDREDENPTFCQTYKCGNQKFYCEKDTSCIWRSFVCDGIPHCSDGSDEISCQSQGSLVLNGYTLKSNFEAKLLSPSAGSHVVYSNLDVIQCATKCNSYQNSYYDVCRGFNIISSREMSQCDLFLTPQNNIELTVQPNVNWYESKIFATCDSSVDQVGQMKFHCRNGRCIRLEFKCNLRDDCGDFSDEQDCTHVSTPQLPSISLNDKRNIGGAQGRVDITYQGETGMLCDNDFDLQDGHVICRQLGFPKALRILKNAAAVYGNGNNRFLLDKLHCIGNESNIDQCPHNGWKRHRCAAAKNVAGVVCAENRACRVNEFRCNTVNDIQFCISLARVCDGNYDCLDGMDERSCNEISVRLIGGPDFKSGVVEINRNGIIGTICDDQFTQLSAKVICRQLGIPGAVRLIRSEFLRGSGVVWFDNVRCIGNESKITDCPHGKWGASICEHSEDVSIECGIESVVAATTVSSSITSTRATSVPCGRRIPSFWRISSGSLADRYHYPWQASIRLRSSNPIIGASESGHWCGATILDEFYLLSASHCFDRQFSKSRYIVRVGDYNNKVEEINEQSFDIDLLIINSNYTGAPTFDSDIAIIKIKPKSDGSGIRWTATAQPVCLPNDDENLLNSESECYISGWGQLGTLQYPSLLQAARVPLFPQAACNKSYEGQITSRMLCAGQPGGADACQGDSGGPMVCFIKGIYVLYGVTSFGSSCGLPSAYIPGVYVNVPYFVSWIRNNIKKL